jgi:NADH:ubiquinone oxidoreductase, Na(+)-translocating, A subunit
MANVIKLRKGLDIHLTGKVESTQVTSLKSKKYAVVPDSFGGVIPKVLVREGDHVKAGDALFVNKRYPEEKFASPVSGEVTAVIRGDRRKVLSIVIEADEKQEYIDFGQRNVEMLTGDEVKQALLEAGLFGFIQQLPYAVATTPDTLPRDIFVSAFRDMPLTADFEVELKGHEAEFQAGLTALSKMQTTHLSVHKRQTATALLQAKGVELHVIDGKCPAGNVGVQINHIAPVNKGEVVWTVDPAVVIIIGRLFLTGKVDLRRVIAVAGSEVNHPTYVEALVGTPLAVVLDGQLKHTAHVRVINGNPLTGTKTTLDGVVGAHTSEITVIPEGDNLHEMLGWILPRFQQFSTSRSYFSWLLGKREYNLDARVKGGERHMIMSGEYDKVLPMDIYGEYLIKAILAEDIDKMEQLGIYEVSPEDFALAEFVDSSKLELQAIVRRGLDMLRKENA